jgi:CheY-like chemotaxis protein
MSIKPRILYVDDEIDLLMLASSFFADESLPIETCSSMSEALQRIKQGTYDLIISDARMPSGTGQELLTKLRNENLFQGKFILVTGNLDHDNLPEQGCDLVLFKPLRLQELVEQAKNIITSAPVELGNDLNL